MKYTIELTSKQKKVMDCLVEIIHRYIGFNPKFEMDIPLPMKASPAYKKGFEDGKNEAIYNTELIPELKKCNYTLGYNEALEDVSNLIAFCDYHFMQEYYPEEIEKGYTLCNLNDKYGLAEVLKNWKAYTKQKKEVENYHKLVDTLRTVTDEYPRETIVSALSEFGIEVKE